MRVQAAITMRDDDLGVIQKGDILDASEKWALPLVECGWLFLLDEPTEPMANDDLLDGQEEE